VPGAESSKSAGGRSPRGAATGVNCLPCAAPRTRPMASTEYAVQFRTREGWLPKMSGIRNILQAFPRAARGVRRRPRAEPFSKWRKAQGRNRLIENDLADCAAPLGLSTSRLCADGRLRISNFTGLPMTDGRPGGRPRGSVRQSDLAQPIAHSRPPTGLGCRLICGK
jgi:hypothetical protein